jgi:hypothetical protein
MTKFTAIYNGKKTSIEGKSLWDAKQKAIKELKVPKSKEGFVSIMSDKSIANQDFRFMEKGGGVGMASKVKKIITRAVQDFDKENHEFRFKQFDVEEYNGDYFVEYVSQEDEWVGGEKLGKLLNSLSKKLKVQIYLYYIIRDDHKAENNIRTKKGYTNVSKFGLGGVLLGSAIGGYAGYKIGRARPQKSGFDTEKKIASKLKKGASKVKQDLKEGAEKRKKKKLATSMARGGGVKTKEQYEKELERLKKDLWDAKQPKAKILIAKRIKDIKGLLNTKYGSTYAEGGGIDPFISSQTEDELRSQLMDTMDEDDVNSMSREEVYETANESYLMDDSYGIGGSTYAEGGKISSKANGGWGINLKWW